MYTHTLDSSRLQIRLALPAWDTIHPYIFRIMIRIKSFDSHGLQLDQTSVTSNPKYIQVLGETTYIEQKMSRSVVMYPCLEILFKKKRMHGIIILEEMCIQYVASCKCHYHLSLLFVYYSSAPNLVKRDALSLLVFTTHCFYQR